MLIALNKTIELPVTHFVPLLTLFTSALMRAQNSKVGICHYIFQGHIFQFRAQKALELRQEGRDWLQFKDNKMFCSSSTCLEYQA